MKDIAEALGHLTAPAARVIINGGSRRGREIETARQLQKLPDQPEIARAYLKAIEDRAGPEALAGIIARARSESPPEIEEAPIYEPAAKLTDEPEPLSVVSPGEEPHLLDPSQALWNKLGAMGGEPGRFCPFMRSSPFHQDRQWSLEYLDSYHDKLDKDPAFDPLWMRCVTNLCFGGVNYWYHDWYHDLPPVDRPTRHGRKQIEYRPNPHGDPTRECWNSIAYWNLKIREGILEGADHQILQQAHRALANQLSSLLMLDRKDYTEDALVLALVQHLADWDRVYGQPTSERAMLEKSLLRTFPQEVASLWGLVTYEKNLWTEIKVLVKSEALISSLQNAGKVLQKHCPSSLRELPHFLVPLVRYKGQLTEARRRLLNKKVQEFVESVNPSYQKHVDLAKHVTHLVPECQAAILSLSAGQSKQSKQASEALSLALSRFEEIARGFPLGSGLDVSLTERLNQLIAEAREAEPSETESRSKPGLLSTILLSISGYRWEEPERPNEDGYCFPILLPDVDQVEFRKLLVKELKEASFSDDFVTEIRDLVSDEHIYDLFKDAVENYEAGKAEDEAAWYFAEGCLGPDYDEEEEP